MDGAWNKKYHSGIFDQLTKHNQIRMEILKKREKGTNKFSTRFLWIVQNMDI